MKRLFEYVVHILMLLFTFTSAAITIALFHNIGLIQGEDKRICQIFFLMFVLVLFVALGIEYRIGKEMDRKLLQSFFMAAGFVLALFFTYDEWVLNPVTALSLLAVNGIFWYSCYVLVTYLGRGQDHP